MFHRAWLWPPVLPALTGTIDKLHGQVGSGTGIVNATLSVALSDDTLRLPGETPVRWSGVTSELHSSGDWIAKNLTHAAHLDRLERVHHAVEQRDARFESP
jgi:hypothetical protein